MHAAVKVLLGLIFIGIGLGLFVDSVYPIMGIEGTFGIDWLQNFIIVLTGFIPAFLIIIGLFVVWLEVDEMKAEKELRREEEKAKASESKAIKKAASSKKK